MDNCEPQEKNQSPDERMIFVRDLRNQEAWDKYAAGHPAANAYQIFAWQDIIKKAYGCKSYALAAFAGKRAAAPEGTENELVGLLPLIHMKTPILGNRLVSIPYFDHGGVLADHAAGEKQLTEAAIHLALKLGAKRIELRQLNRLTTLDNTGHQETNHTIRWGKVPPDITIANRQPKEVTWSVKSHKVRMLLPLHEDAEAMMKSFKSKLRSQIKRPIKTGLTVKIGGAELLEDFYSVFCTNMRDLGSPVHGKALPGSVLEHFRNKAWIVLVYKAKMPVAASLMAGFNHVMINPWSSALREYSKDSPNMLLYWSMLAFAADHGYRFFDFGRSTPGEGTYRFKTQWGAKPHPMYWYTLWLDRAGTANSVKENVSESKKRALAISLWQKLPVPISRVIGPLIRKHIEL